MHQIDFTHQAGYTFKDLHFGERGRSQMARGIDLLEKAVGSTLGARGKTVVIESKHHVGGLTVTKDGITVAKSIWLKDPVANLGVMMARQASENTAKEAGDGTSSSLVLTKALIDAGFAMIKDNGVEVLRCLVDIVKEEVLPGIFDHSIALDDAKLRAVSVISTNNDVELGGVIADCFIETGEDGIVTMESSDNSDTYHEVIEGIIFRKGWVRPIFINSQERDECIFENPYVFVSDVGIQSIDQITGLLPYMSKSHSMLIIAPVDPQILAILAKNKMEGNVNVCVVDPPQFGFKQREILSDIAHAVGAVYFSTDQGDTLSGLSEEHLGRCARVVVAQDKTILFGGNGKEKDKRIRELKKQLKIAKDKDFVRERIAALAGKIGKVFVGAKTDIELKERKDRVDDAICAVRSAREEGIVPGGGISLVLVAEKISNVKSKSDAEATARQILYQALYSPMERILGNAGKSDEQIQAIIDDAVEKKMGYDVMADRHCDMVEAGIVDPHKVVRLSVQNAVSVAVTILGSDAIITEVR